MNLKLLKRVFCIFNISVFLFTLTACKKEETTVTSSETASVVSTVSAENGDIADPENLDLNTESGVKVEADKLEVKKGKANGVDVSKWQGKINWKSVKNAGIDFAIIRIGFRGEDGVIYKDDYADYNIQQADKAGLLIGVYFFSTAKTTAEATEEAKWTTDNIAGYPISYPVVYDCEGFTSQNSRMYSLSNSIRTENALAFLNHVKSAGYEGMFYAAKSELQGEKYWDTARIESTFPIWLANFSSTPYPYTETPDYSGEYSIWQYTDKGSVNGITGNVDLSVSYITREKTAAKVPNSRPADTSAPSEDSKIYTSVSEQVTAKDETNLRSEPTTNSTLVATIKNGEFVKRVGVSPIGWTKLLYNGITVYAKTSLLTTEIISKPIENTPVSDGFSPASGKVTAKTETNLRSAPTTNDSQVIYTLKNGEFAELKGKSDKGWSKLIYNGQTVYAISSYLLTESEYNAQTVPENTETANQ